MPGKTTATIDRERRDALYELVLDHLSGIGDFWLAIEEKDFAKAERLGIEFGEDFRLLEDIGWEPEHGHATVALTIPPHDLIERCGGCMQKPSACWWAPPVRACWRRKRRAPSSATSEPGARARS